MTPPPSSTKASPTIFAVHTLHATSATPPGSARDLRDYTCPMHPEIVQKGPGSCPICGMALEPVTMESGDDTPDAELVDMERRFWICLVLALPVFVLGMQDVVGLRLMPMGPAMNWSQLAFATPVVLWGAWPFFARAWASVVSRNLNMFTLIGLGVGVAYVYSVVATAMPSIFPQSCRGMHGEVGVYFESAGT